MRLALLLLLTSCAHAPVRLFCSGEPVCVREDEALWRCTCPALDDDYPGRLPGEVQWYVMAGESPAEE